MTNQEPTKKTDWHHIFAALLDELLSPLGIKVDTDVPISAQPPEIDIVLLQQTASDTWTDEQRAYLPDGIRDSLANRVVIELKITESANAEAIKQALMYDIGYQRDQRKKQTPDKPIIIQSFLVSAKTPDKQMLAEYGYQPTEQAGVYRSDNIFIQEMPLLLLNELSDEAHNAFFKLFASRQQEKQIAIKSLRRWWFERLSWPLQKLIQGLLKYWLTGETIVERLSVEDLRELGKSVKDLIVPFLDEEDWAEILASTTYIAQVEQRGLLKGREEGREEGEQKARQAFIKTIRQTLAIRFHIELEQYDAQLSSLALPALETLNDVAFAADTLAQFEAQLTNLSEAANNKPPPSQEENNPPTS